MSSCRLLIADGEPVVVAGLRACLNSDSQFEIVGSAQHADDLERLLGAQQPDLALVDPGLQGLCGLQGIARLHARYPRVRLALFGRCKTATEVRAAFRSGASAYLLREEPVGDLPLVLASVASGHRYVPAALVPFVLDATADGDGGLGDLTRQEVEVLRRIGAGQTTREICRELGIRTPTAYRHRANIMRKTQVHSVVELARLAIRTGLARLD